MEGTAYDLHSFHEWKEETLSLSFEEEESWMTALVVAVEKIWSSGSAYLDPQGSYIETIVPTTRAPIP